VKFKVKKIYIREAVPTSKTIIPTFSL